MQHLLFIIMLSFWSIASIAQKGNTFSVTLNGKSIFKNKVLPEQEAVKCKIKKSAFKLSNLLVINIKEKEPNPDWHRIFIIMNQAEEEMGREIQKTTSGAFTLKLRMPADFKKGTIRILTMLEPNDPNQAALIRLRTFPLFDLQIQ